MFEPWTAQSIRALLARCDQAVERAVVAIYRRQTQDEQQTDETRHRNGIGFAACHAGRGSYYARWVLSGRHLDGLHLEKARRMMRSYAGQLAAIAAEHSPQVEEREVVHV